MKKVIRKSGRGGKRSGAGRKVGSKTAKEKLRPEAATISIRHKKAVIDVVKAKYPGRGEIARLGQEWLDSLL